MGKMISPETWDELVEFLEWYRALSESDQQYDITDELIDRYLEERE